MSKGTLEPRHVRCVTLRLAGYKQTEIAKALEVDDGTISRWLQLPEVKQAIAETAADAIAAGGTLLRVTYSEAVQTLRRLLESEDEGVRLRAASEILDRVPLPQDDGGNPADAENVYAKLGAWAETSSTTTEE